MKIDFTSKILYKGARVARKYHPIIIIGFGLAILTWWHYIGSKVVGNAMLEFMDGFIIEGSYRIPSLDEVFKDGLHMQKYGNIYVEPTAPPQPITPIKITIQGK